MSTWAANIRNAAPVAQVVQPNRRQIGLPRQLLEPRTHRRRMQARAIDGGKHCPESTHFSLAASRAASWRSQ